jgi:hypothetical protein
MAIRVTTHGVNTTDSQIFPESTGWHVDDAGRLHVTAVSKGNTATFHPSAWISVEKQPEAS